ncbi:MAG: hypothetical protein WC138_13195 [Methanoculleus sp.]
MARLVCPHCGNDWEYRGRAAPGQYVCCPACSSRFKRPHKAVVNEETTNVTGACQRCGEICDALRIVQLDDGEVVLVCGRCVEEGKF